MRWLVAYQIFLLVASVLGGVTGQMPRDVSVLSAALSLVGLGIAVWWARVDARAAQLQIEAREASDAIRFILRKYKVSS